MKRSEIKEIIRSIILSECEITERNCSKNSIDEYDNLGDIDVSISEEDDNREDLQEGVENADEVIDHLRKGWLIFKSAHNWITLFKYVYNGSTAKYMSKQIPEKIFLTLLNDQKIKRVIYTPGLEIVQGYAFMLTKELIKK